MKSSRIVGTAILVAAGYLNSAACVWAQTLDQETRGILRQAALYQDQFRRGRTDTAPEYVAMLEQATAAQHENAELWYAMGVAHFTNAARAALEGGGVEQAAPSYQKGSAAIERALELDPEHAEALALRAGTRLMLASFARKPEVVEKLRMGAVAEMNRAIEISPDSKRARLQRAFSGLTLPEDLRNHASEAEDLEFLMASAGKSRPGDYIRLMRADLHFELGETTEARALYGKVERSKSPAAQEAKVRLAFLDMGEVPMADIKTLRTAAGADCVMCHGE